MSGGTYASESHYNSHQAVKTDDLWCHCHYLGVGTDGLNSNTDTLTFIRLLSMVNTRMFA